MSTTVKLTFETGDRPPDEVEREVQEAVEAATGETPNTSQYAGNVVWSPGGVPEVDHVHDVEVPRAIRTRYNDTVDSGDGTLLERVDGRFVAVDDVGSPKHDYGNHVLDYFRINYGIAPWYRYSKPDDPGTLSRPGDREDWGSILSPSAFEVPDFGDERAAVESLDGDPGARARAARYVAFEGTDDPGHYERFLSALGTVDERTRALVASSLWDPAPVGDDGVDHVSLVESLLALVDDPVPEVRIGAFMGAARALEPLASADGDASEADLDDVARSFYEAHAALLDDDDPRIRERVVRCLGETLGDQGGHVFDDDPWLRVEFPLRWRVARGVEDNVHDDDLGSLEAPDVTRTAFDDEPSAVPTLVEYAYDRRGPSYRTVRGMLADFAEDDPGAATGALEPALDAVAAGEALVADVRLLAALAMERPDRVATVTDELAAMLDAGGDRDEVADSGYENWLHKDYVDQEDREELRRVAAQALNELPADTHPVERSTLAAVVGDVTREEYDERRLAPDRVATLARIDPDAAVDRLRSLPGEVGDGRDDDGFRRSRVESAVYETSDVAPGVVARALPDLVALLEDPAGVSEELAVGVARTALERPGAVADHVDAVGSLLGHHEPIVREAAATALVAVGRERPEALPEPYAGLSERSDDALDVGTVETVRDRNDLSPETPADWPAGVLASDAPTLVDAVAACLDEDFYQHEGLADLLREVRAGDPGAAERLLAELLDRRREVVLPSGYRTGVVTLLADTDPALVAGAADSLVAVLADPEFETEEYPDRDRSRPSSGAKSLEAGLLAVAGSDPAAAREAVEAHYPSVEAFVDDHATDRRREVASLLGEGGTPRIADAGAEAAGGSGDGPSDPFLSFRPGEYGTDLVVDADDLDDEPTDDALRVVRCRVTDDDVLRRVDDDAFVRRVVGPDGPVGSVPDDADPEDEPVSLVVYLDVPESFVRLAAPDDENVLTRAMDLEYDVDGFDVFARLCRSIGEDYDREDVEAVERRLDQLSAIEDVDGAAELVEKQFL